MNDRIEECLAAEAAAESRGYVTDGKVKYILTTACAPLEVPFPWWTVSDAGEQVSVEPQASVAQLLERARSQDRER